VSQNHVTSCSNEHRIEIFPNIVKWVIFRVTLINRQVNSQKSSSLYEYNVMSLRNGWSSFALSWIIWWLLQGRTTARLDRQKN
jgi:hypothetical protein